MFDMRRGFFGWLPRPARWLWFAILAVIAVECAVLALGVVLGGEWWWAALQLSSVLTGPLVLGLLVVVAAGAWAGRRARPPSEADERSDAEQPRTEPSRPSVPVEVAVGRRAGEAVAAVARSREGKAAIRQTARLVRAVRAAAQPPPASDEAERRSGGEP
jgi:type VI protein secretion system component VasK